MLYFKKQLAQTNQNSKLKVFKSLKWNLSSSDIILLFTPSFLSACLSKSTSPIAEAREIIQIMNPTKRAPPSPEPSYTIGTTIPFKVEPSLDILKFNPNANANSFPLNHLDIIADYATLRDSPPKLKKIS